VSDAEWNYIVGTAIQAAQQWSAWDRVFLVEIGVQP